MECGIDLNGNHSKLAQQSSKLKKSRIYSLSMPYNKFPWSIVFTLAVIDSCVMQCNAMQCEAMTVHTIKQNENEPITKEREKENENTRIAINFSCSSSVRSGIYHLP